MDKVTAMKRKSNRLDTSRKRIKLPASLVQLMDMNDDCLIHVLQFLDIISLAKMSKADQRFYNLITTYIIPKCTIDVSTFSKHCSVRKIFALFGKSMTSIVMSTDDIQIAVPRHSKFDEMLCMLVKYGEPGSLKYVDLQIGHISGMMWDGHHFCSTQNKLLNEVAPYFANVHTLKLEVAEYSNMAAFNKFVNAIDKQNIRTLHVNNVPFIDTWLSAQSFPSLQSIHLRIAYQNYFDQNRLNATSESRLIHFISCKPASLINFKYIGAWSDAIFVELSRHIPSIERVSQIKYWPNNGAGNNNNNNAGLATLGFHAKWKYFNDFTNLKSVELRSETTDFSDSGEAFSIMAKRNTIEKLELTFGSNETNQGKNEIAPWQNIKLNCTLSGVEMYYQQISHFVCGFFQVIQSELLI